MIKAAKGKHTKPNAWDRARKLKLIRHEPDLGRKEFTLEPGVNFFIAMLDQIGCRTFYSCEGHPKGFSIMFGGPYPIALKIADAGYFGVTIHRKNVWVLSTNDTAQELTTGPVTPKSRADQLRWASEAWEEKLGKLDFGKIKLRF